MKTTREVAEQLGISPAALRAHLASGNVARPERRAGLMFLWTRDEIEAAARSLSVPGRRRPRYVAEALGVSGESSHYTTHLPEIPSGVHAVATGPPPDGKTDPNDHEGGGEDCGSRPGGTT